MLGVMKAIVSLNATHAKARNRFRRAIDIRELQILPSLSHLRLN